MAVVHTASEALRLADEIAARCYTAPDMKKGKGVPLPPELMAKYQRWLKNTPGGTPERYLQEGEIAASQPDAEELETFRRWLREAKPAGEMEFEENEDAEVASEPRPEIARSGFDALTRFLIEKRFVATKREALIVQCGAAAVIAAAIAYGLWSR